MIRIILRHFFLRLGKCYLLGHHDEALAAFKALLTHPTHLGPTSSGHNSYEQGRKEEAREALRAAGKINPTFSFARMKAILPYKDPKLVEHWTQQLRELDVE